MVFSAPLITTTTTGVLPRERPQVEQGRGLDPQPLPAVHEQASEKHDVVSYTMFNAPFIGLAGLVAGFQEAFYKFEKMPPAETRRTVSQAVTLFRIVGRKTLFATALGAVFCATEATLENARGKHDITNGMVAGAAAGLLFGMVPPKPMPQPLVWPLAFAAVAAAADLMGEQLPETMKTMRTYGPLEGRSSWGDPAPPRPPVLDTGASVRPMSAGQFWRGG